MASRKFSYRAYFRAVVVSGWNIIVLLGAAVAIIGGLIGENPSWVIWATIIAVGLVLGQVQAAKVGFDQPHLEIPPPAVKTKPEPSPMTSPIQSQPPPPAADPTEDETALITRIERPTTPEEQLKTLQTLKALWPKLDEHRKEPVRRRLDVVRTLGNVSSRAERQDIIQALCDRQN
jgi:hypothetical protein